jgi:hypothetical protein
VTFASFRTPSFNHELVDVTSTGLFPYNQHCQSGCCPHTTIHTKLELPNRRVPSAGRPVGSIQVRDPVAITRPDAPWALTIYLAASFKSRIESVSSEPGNSPHINAGQLVRLKRSGSMDLQGFACWVRRSLSLTENMSTQILCRSFARGDPRRNRMPISSVVPLPPTTSHPNHLVKT